MISVRYNGVTLIAFHVFEGHFSIIWPLPENITIILFINIFSVLNANMKSSTVFQGCAIVSRFYNDIAIGFRIYFGEK